jgi:hypothetical protein
LFNIRLGNTKLSTDDPNMLLLATETYFLHPDYDPLTLRNDIGLIKLRMEVFFTGILNIRTSKNKTNNPKKF